MGSLAKKMLKQQTRTANKKALNDLRSVGRSPLFLLVNAKNGAPLMRTVAKGDEPVVVTWCFTAHPKADAFLQSMADNEDFKDEEISISRLPADQFLGSLLNHLAQADIDYLLLDGETELPLTTIGVRLLDDEKWTGLLNKTRDVGANLLLAQVVMDVLQAAHPPSAVVVETATYADLVRMLMGKNGRFPAPDLGICWMLASSVKDGVEPIFLKLTEGSPDNTTGSDLAVGPMFFSDYRAALNWPKVLPVQLVAHLADLKLHLVPYRAMGLLEEVNENFPTATVDERKPDVFLIDGGALPMTKAGAVYTDFLAYGDDVPEKSFSTIAEESETELHKATVLLLAQHLGIRIVQEAAPEPAEETADVA
jgi:hypothetical protein